MNKKVKGITLIALVITIVVLLILAGVTISTLTGENRILTKAVEAKEKTQSENIREKVKLDILDSLDNDGKFNMDMLKENLKKHLNVKDEDIKDDSDGGIIVTIDGYDIKVDKFGNLKVGSREETLPCAHDNMSPYDNNTHVCDNCGYTEQHHMSWTDRYSEGHCCDECGYYEYHNWNSDEGICTICGGDCIHGYPTIQDNSYMVGIDDYNDQCSRCGYQSSHDYSDYTGRCLYCGWECTHGSLSGESTFDHGRCNVCGKQCEHFWNSGQCDVCGLQCSHEWDSNGWCWVCNWQCPHYFIDNGDGSTHTCTNCGYAESHSYDESGNCMVCGK